jgi:hypothetical protein
MSTSSVLAAREKTQPTRRERIENGELYEREARLLLAVIAASEARQHAERRGYVALLPISYIAAAAAHMYAGDGTTRWLKSRRRISHR